MIWYMGQRNKSRVLKHKKFKALGEVSCLLRILDEMRKGLKLENDIHPSFPVLSGGKSNDIFSAHSPSKKETESPRKLKYSKPK